MKSAYDVMLDSIQLYTIGYEENQYPTYTFEGGGPKFFEFIKWLKRTPYKEYVHEPVDSVREPEDEGISW